MRLDGDWEGRIRYKEQRVSMEREDLLSIERDRRRLKSYFGIKKNNQKNDEEIRLKKVKGLDIGGVTSGGE